MIQGERFIFVEIPRTCSTVLSTLMVEQGASRITPRHDPLWDKTGITKPVFTVVRHPFARINSLYHYFTEGLGGNKKVSFEEWFAGSGEFQQEPLTYWTRNCDYIFEYDRLQQDLTEYKDLLGYHYKLPKHTPTKYKRFTKKQKDMIYDRFSKDFEKFDYGYKGRVSS